MVKKEEQKLLKQREKASEFLNFIASEHGISTDGFLNKLDVLKRFSLEQISHALTHYCFRNGPVEDMHASPNDQLSQDDMKILNKYCNDKLFTFLTMIRENKVAELIDIIEFGLQCGNDWDKPEYREED